MPNNRRKIQLNKEPLSSGDIAKGKDFSKLFSSYTAAAGAAAPAAVSVAGILKIGAIILSAAVISVVVAIMYKRVDEKKIKQVEKKKELMENVVEENNAIVMNEPPKGNTTLPAANANPVETVNNNTVINDASNENKKSVINTNTSNAASAQNTTLSSKENKTRESKIKERKNKKANRTEVNANAENKKPEMNIALAENAATVSVEQGPSAPEQQHKVKRQKNNERKKQAVINEVNTTNESPDQTIGESIVSSGNKKQKKKKTKENTSLSGTSISENAAVDQKILTSESASVNNEPVNFLSNKTILLSDIHVSDPKELGLTSIEDPDYIKRRDFEPRFTLGVKAAEYITFSSAGSYRSYFTSSMDQFWFNPLWEENYDADKTYWWVNDWSGHNVGISGSLRMFKRCYIEVDIVRMRRQVAGMLFPGQGVSYPFMCNINNLQSDIGVSYWFGKKRLEFGLNPGVSRRLINKPDNESHLEFSNWGNSSDLRSFPLSAYSFFGKISVRYNFKNFQLRSDIGIHGRDLFVRINPVTISCSLGVYYKFY